MQKMKSDYDNVGGLTILDAILIFFSIKYFSNFHQHPLICSRSLMMKNIIYVFFLSNSFAKI